VSQWFLVLILSISEISADNISNIGRINNINPGIGQYYKVNMVSVTSKADTESTDI